MSQSKTTSSPAPLEPGSPMTRISGSSSTPRRACTRSRVTSISASTSAAVASARFTMKFACVAEISAPPIRLPLSPTSSMSRPATSPGGFFHTQPAEASASGRFSDQRRERHSRPHDGLVLPDVDVGEGAVELHDETADAAIPDEEIVTAADHLDGEPLAGGERERQPEIFEVPRNDQNVGGAAHAERS